MSKIYHIKTEKSFLTTIDLDQKYYKLVEDCIKYIDNKLNHKPEIIIMGKKCYQNRDVGFFSDKSIGYHYSNKLMKSQKLDCKLKELINIINDVYKSDFNGILINKYNDGTENIGKHSDNEKMLDKTGVVALSYGASRKFRIRDKNTNKIIKDIDTGHMVLLHMGGDFQKEFTHEIPVEKKVSGCRYSFTFRKHLI